MLTARGSHIFEGVTDTNTQTEEKLIKEFEDRLDALSIEYVSCVVCVMPMVWYRNLPMVWKTRINNTNKKPDHSKKAPTKPDILSNNEHTDACAAVQEEGEEEEKEEEGVLQPTNRGILGQEVSVSLLAYPDFCCNRLYCTCRFCVRK